MTEYIAMWKNYVNFTDRTSRKGYWMVILINFIILLIFSVMMQYSSVFGMLYSVYNLAILLPSLGISVRRLRNAGKGWG